MLRPVHDVFVFVVVVVVVVVPTRFTKTHRRPANRTSRERSKIDPSPRARARVSALAPPRRALSIHSVLSRPSVRAPKPYIICVNSHTRVPAKPKKEYI
jgi:hypothetical protein